MGAVTPLGAGVGRFIAALREGRSGVRPFHIPDEVRTLRRVRSTVAAAITPDLFDPVSVMDEADAARLPRCVPMALAAAREALAQARLLEPSRSSLVGDRFSRRYGLILGTGADGIDFTSDQAEEVYARNGRGSLWTITNATHGNLAGELSIRLGLRGPSWCVSTGCASALDALGMAVWRLRAESLNPQSDNALDGFVVVGADAHVRWETLYGMELLRVISTRDWAADGLDPSTASRPFDRSREGFVLGEGAWAVVIERAGADNAHNAPPGPPVGEVLGYGATCDAYHRVRPAPDMAESARAMRTAVRDAGLRPEDVELIHYHGTATRLNDALETSAVKLAFGDHARRLRGSSIKGSIGHPQGACGLASLVATLGSLTPPPAPGARPFIPPTVNLHEPDTGDGCDLDYTPLRAVETTARIALINCLAFGAKNTTVVVRSALGYPAAPRRDESHQSQ